MSRNTSNYRRRNAQHKKKRMSEMISTPNRGSSKIEVVVQNDNGTKTNVNGNRKRGGRNRKGQTRGHRGPSVQGGFPKLQSTNGTTMYSQVRRAQRALEEPNEQYPQVQLIPVNVLANVNAIWDFCVAYASVGMWNAQKADDYTELLGGGQIGTYYLAALTLFYSLYQSSVGAVPVLQKVSQELMNLMHAFSPCNYKNVSYTVRWSNPNIFNIMQTLPYRSFANPAISLAPWTGALDTYGRRVVSNTLPAFTLDDFAEVGPRAFEYVQRSFLNGRLPIVDYTTDGPYKNNTAIFAVARDFTGSPPITGFVQLVNESPMYQDDYWLLTLGFSAPGTARDSYNTKTVQQGTMVAIRRIMTGNTSVNQANIQCVDIGLIIAQEVSTMVSADVNILDYDLKDLDSMGGAFPSRYLTEMRAGDWITKIIADSSRRFGLLSCMAAGNILPSGQGVLAPSLIGGGSQFLIGAIDDNSVSPLNLVEDLAALSSFVDENNCYYAPLLVSRGKILTLDMITPASNSLLYWLDEAFPTMEAFTSYNMATPGVGDLPDNIDMNSLTASFTSGPGPVSAINLVSSVIELMQGNVAVGAASGSNDAYEERHLYMTHVLEGATPSPFNLSPTFVAVYALSTCKFTQKELASKFARLFPVFYTRINDPQTLTDDYLPAYQQLMKKPYSVSIGIVYTEYRISAWSVQGHKLAANFFSPSEQSARATHKTVIGAGGAFHDIFFKDGQWVSALEHLAGGIGNLFSPEAGKVSKMLAGKVGKALHEAFKVSKVPKFMLNPVDSGLLSRHEYFNILSRHEKSL